MILGILFVSRKGVYLAIDPIGMLIRMQLICLNILKPGKTRAAHFLCLAIGIYFFIISFNCSSFKQKVQRLWKTSTVIPVAKNNHPVVLNDFRPVALTSLVMKSFERLLKKELLIKVEGSFDPLQFAYWAKRGF